MAPRCVLTPEVAASMAASASRPMTLSRPMPQPSRAGVGQILEIWLDGRGAAAKRVGVHVVVTAVVDMAHEAGLRPGFQFQRRQLDGAVADRIGIEHGAWRSSRMRQLRVVCQSGGHDSDLSGKKVRPVEQGDAVDGLDQHLARTGVKFAPVHGGAVVADQLAVEPHRRSGLDRGEVSGQAVEDRYRDGRAAAGRDRSRSVR